MWKPVMSFARWLLTTHERDRLRLYMGWECKFEDHRLCDES